MPEKLAHNSYGKSDVRVTKVIRQKDRHELIELSVDLTLLGDFVDTYLSGDNQRVIATDSMKNTIYALAKRHPLTSIESFALDLSAHFASTYPQVQTACATVRQHNWQRIAVDGRPHPHAFVSGGNELRTCRACASGDGRTVSGGLQDVLVLKTTDSAFEGFVRDEYTTLKDASDRIFATSVTANWFYNAFDIDYNVAFTTIRTALLETFARHQSKSVQQTLYAMGQAALQRCADIHSINLTMPNKHRVLVDLGPFALSNDNEIFVWTDQPYGSIQGSVKRS